MSKKKQPAEPTAEPTLEEIYEKNRETWSAAKKVAAACFTKTPKPEEVFGCADAVRSFEGNADLAEAMVKDAIKTANAIGSTAKVEDIFAICDLMLEDEYFDTNITAARDDARAAFGPTVTTDAVIHVYVELFRLDE